MKVLYIIGNGFDMNLKLKTGYDKFYKYYQKIVSKTENVANLKKALNRKDEDWADLEIALGQYTKKLEEPEEWDEVHIDIIKNLSRYLKREETKIAKKKFNQRKFYDYLCYPERQFNPKNQEKIQLIKNKWNNISTKIYIVTLNYTGVIQKILGGIGKDVNIGSNYILKSITHLHGNLDNEMVLGVNDKTQIAKESFRENQDILDSLVKIECNNANGNFNVRDFTTKINNANLICIFGSSIGLTDKKWWELIGERIKKDCHLLYFTKGPVIERIIASRQRATETKLKNTFLKKANIPEIDYPKLRDKIFVGYNRGMFSDIIVDSENQIAGTK